VIPDSLERTPLRPSLWLRTCAWILPLQLLALTIPNLAFSQPSGSPELAPEVRGRLARAAADTRLPSWQREYMERLAQASKVAVLDPGVAGDGAVASANLPGATDDARASLDATVSARDAHTAIYDPVRERMLVFGGWNAATHFNDVWALSLAGTPVWTELTPSGTPPSARRFQSAIYDPVRDRMLVFGGFTGEVYLNDVWALSLAGTPAWTELTPSGTPPHTRYRQSAIYDPVRDRMVVFAGWWSGTNFNDVWELSLAGTPAWTELAPSGTPPSARYSHSAIYDPVRDRMVVFGGVEEGFLKDVWALSFADSLAWAELTPSGPLPHTRYVHSAVYDSVRDRMVVFGGYDGETYRADAWALSLAEAPAWTELTPGGTAPGGRYGHSAIYDPVRDRMVVFGGFSDSGFFGDAWELTLAGTTAWTEMLAPELHTLTVSATHGSVTQDPLPSGGTYAHGTAVLLTATPESGYHFVGFSGDVVAVSDTVTVIMTGDKTVTASFSVDSLTLTVSATHGSVTQDPLPSEGKYVYGTAVLLTATPELGYHFAGFSGDVVAVTDTVTVIMTGDKTVTATYSLEPVTLTVNAANGSVTQDPLPIRGRYAYGTAVLLTATPDAGHHFVDYSGDVAAVTDTVTVIMTGDKTVTANFVADSVTLTVNATNGSVTASPLPSGGKYAYGTAVLLMETPEAGYHFVDYSGDVVAVTDTVTVIMTADKTVTANFQVTAGVAGKVRPTVTLLMPAMPNPFRQSATLTFSIARGGRVDLAVYSVDGRRVRTLVRESREPGEYRAVWDGRDDGGNPIAVGVYYARLETVDRPLTRVVTHLK
jgi:hypothetical protein